MLVAGCQQGGQPAVGADKNAGLDVAIKAWHANIKDTDAMCANKPEGQGCQAFEVACKVESPIGPEEKAAGVTAKVIAAMSWEAWNPKTSEFRSQSDVVQFTKIGQEWTRADAPPVNLSTCA